MSLARRHARAPRRHLGWALAAIAIAAGAAALGAPEANASQRPNVVVVVTDDQTLASLDSGAMPATERLLRDRGTEFTDAVVSTPVCCPSRASLLSGQYAHNHGVLSNTPGYRALRGKRNTLPVWLRRAGYLTAHVGKYMNGYLAAAHGAAEIAPGWNEWHTVVDRARNDVRYYRYRLAVNGRVQRAGKRPGDYITRTINRRAARLVRRHSGRGRPLFLQVDHRAPHVEVGARSPGRCGGLVPPDPRDAEAFRDAPLPRPPSFDEPDVADKPSFIRRLPRLRAEEIARIELRYRCALASLRSVDRGVARIFRELRRARALAHTAVVFTSDNGFFFGEHRITEQKTRPYEEALRVPLLIRLPARHRRGAARVPRVEAPVSNVDLAPTVLDLARARPCRARGRCRMLDGRSLVGLLRGSAAWPAERAVLVEFDAGPRARPGRSCAYRGVRVAGHVYVRHTAAPDPLTRRCEPIDEVEHYELGSDPFQLLNLHAFDPLVPVVQAQLDQRLGRLSECAGVVGPGAVRERGAPPAGRPLCE